MLPPPEPPLPPAPIDPVLLIAVASGAARLPDRVSWCQIGGGGVLCGIGFTMALFIASLALGDADLAAAKVGTLSGSAVAAIVGMLVLRSSAHP